MANPTTNFSWTLPVDGGSTAWGPILNTAFQDIDDDLDAVKTTADAALPVAGGTMTGRLAVRESDHILVNQGATMSGTETLDLDTGNVFYGTVTGTTTLAFSNVQSSRAVFWMLELTNGGSQTFNWPGAVNWAGGTAPTLTTSGVDLIGFYSRDGGTTVYAIPLILDAS